MTFSIEMEEARRLFPDYEFITALTPSAQKCAFHVRDSNGTDLCLKIISPDYEMDMLQREIQALQLLDHTNIASLVEFTLSSKQGVVRRYIIEEFIEGHDLGEDLEGTPWPVERLVEVFSELCHGLGALREKNVVHRDLKPSNIRIDEGGTPRLIDFGLARHLDKPDLTNTQEGAGKGTPIYFAPEQFDGTKYDIDHRTDLWALGVLIYEAACGLHPFYKQGMSREALRRAVCEGTAHFDEDAFEALPASLRLLLRKLLEQKREHRPADASQVEKVLARVGGEA